MGRSLIAASKASSKALSLIPISSEGAECQLVRAARSAFLRAPTDVRPNGGFPQTESWSVSFGRRLALQYLQVPLAVSNSYNSL
jgi:hypothetical protein